MKDLDVYKTLDFPSEEILYKDKNSKFFGYSFPVKNEEEIKIQLEQLRKQHSNAGHFCYAFQLGIEKISFRVNDDGEPNNSAGMPIYGQIQSFNVTNVLVVVVRYFGGVKLGVGGLISAYKTAAQNALENSEIVEKTININYTISFDYKNINKIMRIIKEQKLTIISQNMNENCSLEIETRKQNSNKIEELFKAIFEVTIQIKN